MNPEPTKPEVPTMRANLIKTLPLPAALGLALLGSAGAALAQTPPAAAALPAMSAPAKPVFAIRGFDITGDNPLSASETTRILAPFLRADASIDTLQTATAALEAALKAGGFGLHRVVLPPQSVTDSVKLEIVKFVVGKVTVEGLKAYDAANIRASLPELVEGSAPNFRTLAVQTGNQESLAFAELSLGAALLTQQRPAEAATTTTGRPRQRWQGRRRRPQRRQTQQTVVSVCCETWMATTIRPSGGVPIARGRHHQKVSPSLPRRSRGSRQ
jgi:hemolysin activation/secretion protein